MDVIFKLLNVCVVLVVIEMWDVLDKVKVDVNVDIYLLNLVKYR